ncbi:MAG TPA: cell surface protein [Planctomycetaceae bacterium]|nr:cell surface protein [Planctomycetaceae bacterium]HIQ20236.1 cell surface protein [Planctomycetota bacterium]
MSGCFLRSRRWMWAATVTVATGVLSAALAGDAPRYLGPIDVVASPDGQRLFVAEADGGQIAVVDVATQKVKGTVACPAPPSGLVLSPDGKTLYVTCAAPQSTVAIIDALSGKLSGTIPAGHTACGPSISPDGKRLYVCNRFDNDVSVIDLEAKRQVARVAAIREPVASAVTPDGKTVFVANLLPCDPSDSYDVAAEITVIDTASHKTSQIRLLNGSSSVYGICVSPDGKYAYVAHILARYQMPTTQLERGWMNTNAMSILDVAAKKLVNTVLLDDVDLGAANPWGITTSADGKTIFVTHAGTHELSVIDADALLEKVLGMPKTKEEARAAGRYDDQGTYSSVIADDVPNDLAFLVGLRRRIRLRGGGPYGLLPFDGPEVNGPRGLAVVGPKVYVAIYFYDLLAVVDLEDKSYYPVSVIRLGPEPKLTIQRRGQMLFHDADICFQHWQSCASCHPDARVDGLNWDLMNDGMGNPKNARSMLLAHETPPAMASGVRPSAEMAVRSGITHILFAVRPEEEAVAIDEYLKSLEPVPSPRLVNGQLSEAARRGRELFFSERLDCANCHPEPLYTDRRMHDVGSRGKYDRRDDFDTPTLIECWRTAPYMHDGHYVTIKELIAEGKHGKMGGDVEGLSQQEIDDLVEFVLSL